MNTTALSPFRGFGFGSESSSPHSQEDNMFSTDVVEIIFGISEGPIKGPEDGAKSFYAGDTPLRGPTGYNNVGMYDLTFRRGKEIGEPILSKLGGFGSSTTVGVNLAPSVDVIRQGTHTHVDFLDIRMTINRLAKETDKGSFEGTGQFKVQYRKVGSGTWKDLRTLRNTAAPDEQTVNDDVSISRGHKKDRLVSPSPGDRMVYWQNAVPATTDENALWFDSGISNRPKKIVGGSWVNMPGATQFSGDNWQWNQNSVWGNDNLFKAFVDNKKPASPRQGDFWLRVGGDEETIGITYMYNGNSWVISAGSLSPGGFGTGGDTDILPDGVVQVTGRVSSPEVKEFRIPVDNYNGLYEIKVTRVTPANTDEKFFDITWESFQEVTGKALTFEALATTQLVIPSSDKFSSIPDFWGVYEGRIVKVPTNYDPVARTYAGVWDGTWKLAYTNNAAFVGYDVVNNDRYGMKAYYNITLEPMDVYVAGQHCDKICADGTPRFTFNGLLSNPLGGREAVNFIFGIFGGRFFDDGNGKGVLKIDGDNEAATMMFGPENVEDGLFVYSFTDIMSRPNDYTVTFVNPQLDWQQDRRRVFDQDNINDYQRIPQNFEAVGCTSYKEAKRRARYRLVTGLTETRVVSFKTNRMGLYATPYDIILLADPDMGDGLSGRIKSMADTDLIQLRDNIYLEPGFNYTLSFQYHNGVDFEIRKINIVNGTSGSVSQLPLVADMPLDIPELLHFGIERRDGTVAPKAYRIMSIGASEDNPDKIEIQAIEVNRNKWLYIDNFVDDIEDIPVDNSRRLPQPPTDLRMKAEWHKTGGSYIYSVLLDWNRSVSKTVTHYNVYYSRNNGPFALAGKSRGRRLELHHLKQGEYQFQVCAVNHRKFESEGRFIEHRLVGQLSQYNTVEGLRLVDGVTLNRYETRAPVFAWDEVESGRHEKYVIQILDADTDAVMATYKQKPRRFRYAFDDNRADHGGTAARRYKVRLYSQDDDGQWGDPSDLIVSNPAPAVLESLDIEETAYGAFVKFDKPDKRDYQGVIIYASNTNGFTPGPGNLKYKGPDNSVRLKLDKNLTWYVRVAAYDVFGTADLNFSDQVIVSYYDPAVPTGLSATSLGDTDEAGHVRSMIKLDWDANTEPTFDHFELEIQEDGVSFATRSPILSRHWFPGKIGKVYRYRVRACDSFGNKSAWAPAAWGGAGSVVTALGDTVGPAQATGLQVFGRAKGMRLKWDACPEPDYLKTFVWRYDTFEDARDDVNRTLVGTVAGESFIDPSDLPRNTRFWYRIAHQDRTKNTVIKSAHANDWTLNYSMLKAEMVDFSVVRADITGRAVDTDHIEYHSISGLEYMKGPTKANRIQIKYSPDLRWGANTANTTIASPDVAIAVLRSLNNVNPSPITINGTATINAMVRDTNSNSFGNDHESEYVARLVVEGKKSADVTWKPLATIAKVGYKGKASNVRAQVATVPVSFVHAVRPADAGKWDYRVILKFTHRRGSERSWVAGSYVASYTSLTLSYLRR